MLIKINEINTASNNALIFNTDHIIFVEPYHLGGCIIVLTGGRTVYMTHTVEQIAEAAKQQLVVIEMAGKL